MMDADEWTPPKAISNVQQSVAEQASQSSNTDSSKQQNQPDGNVITKEEINSSIAVNITSNNINANLISITNNAAPLSNINDEVNTKISENNEVKPLKFNTGVTDIAELSNSTIKAQGELDRAVPNDKVFQTKNETKLAYQEGQWTHDNTTGSRQYDKDFLMMLRNVPSSRLKPGNIPGVILADDCGLAEKLNSQSENKKDVNLQGTWIVYNKEDVKLHETENAWRPARFKKGEFQTDEDRKTHELYRKVRGLLNKLTPEKFGTILSQIKNLKIDTSNRLQGVIDLVFEKAVEPNCSVVYANMCKELALMQVPTGVTLENNKPEYVNFRKLLICKCQIEFEKRWEHESSKNTKFKKIEECSDLDKKNDLQFHLEEYNRKIRMKSLGNIRFIGELFKQSMLTVNVMMRCLNNLIENKDEESLECLCKLLNTIGKEIEQKVNLQPIFTQMKNLADNKDGGSKISNRIRFMLRDVIDLKNSKWIPRRQKIQKEADNEHMNQMMNVIQMIPRKDDRMGGLGVNVDRKGHSSRNDSDNEGWIINNSNCNRTPFYVQSEKLKAKAPMIDIPVGSSALFGLWGKGAAALENRNLGSESTSWQNGIQVPMVPPQVIKLNLRQTRAMLQILFEATTTPEEHSKNDYEYHPKVRQVAPEVPQMSEDQIDRIGNSLDEYIAGNSSTDEYYQEIKKDYRISGLDLKADRKGSSSRNVSDTEGWITNNSNINRTPFSVQSEKPKAKAQLDFLLDGVTTCESNLSYEDIESQLRELLESSNEFDAIISWITANIGDRVQENRFIRTLATVIFEDSISRKNLKAITNRLTHHNNLLLKYVDDNPTYELQCLYALQALMQRMEHPQGLPLLICHKLYELGTFSQESFIAWEQSTDPAEQEGKDAILQQLTNWFQLLKENDEDDNGKFRG